MPSIGPCAATPLDLSSLCQACGLCCDGSLFGRVGLESHEGDGARKGRLRVVGNGKSFEQPCSALAVATRPHLDHHHCTIYEGRPTSCRRFVCRLYDRYRREGGSIEEPLSVVRRVRALLAGLGLPSIGTRGQAELSRILEESFASARAAARATTE